jgi:nitrogen fixation protein NifM
LSQHLAYLILRTALKQHQTATADLTSQQREDITRQAERQYALEDKVLNAAEATACHIELAQVEAHIDDVRGRYSDEADFIADLQRNGMSLEEFSHAVTRELHVAAIMEHVGAQAPAVTDEDIVDFYSKHQNSFKTGETRTARHILITINPTFEENTREQAWRRINLVAKRLERKPARFAEQAQKHSECPTAMQGGTLGRIAPGTLFPELDKALFALQENQVSEVLESEVGFHILWCEYIHPAGIASLEQATPKITEHLMNTRQQAQIRAWLANL